MADPDIDRIHITRGTDYVTDDVVFRGIHQTTKYAAIIPVSRRLIEDRAAAGDIQTYLEASFDRHLRPWKYPDRNPFPRIELYPRLDRLAAWLSLWVLRAKLTVRRWR